MIAYEAGAEAESVSAYPELASYRVISSRTATRNEVHAYEGSWELETGTTSLQRNGTDSTGRTPSLNIPMCLDDEVQSVVQAIASERNTDLAPVVSQLPLSRPW